MQIREAGAHDAATVATLVAESNKDVARKFGLSAANCPKHPSLCTADWVRADLARGERYFVAEEGGAPVACVAYERPQPDLCYLNRLSVLPAAQRSGVGARLVEHIVGLARDSGVATISIGVIGEHADLQRWYRKLGFVDGETRRFAHLPFSVKYMSYAVEASVPASPKPEIETVASTVVYRNRWLTLREDTIVRADGSTGLYGVVDKADFAVIAALAGDEITLVEQYRYPVQGRYWELPMGAWEDQQDVDPLVLAHAELREETGLSAASMRHVGRLFLAYGYSSQAYDVFLASDLSQGERQLDVEEAGLVARAFTLAEVDEMIRDGTIRDATTVAALGLLRIKGLL